MITNYSVGFVDAGESLAECVIRETAEEAGVKINPESFELVDSNHWPNPAGSLMLGSIVTTKTEVSLFLTIYLSLFSTLFENEYFIMQERET